MRDQLKNLLSKCQDSDVDGKLTQQIFNEMMAETEIKQMHFATVNKLL